MMNKQIVVDVAAGDEGLESLILHSWCSSVGVFFGKLKTWTGLKKKGCRRNRGEDATS